MPEKYGQWEYMRNIPKKEQYQQFVYYIANTFFRIERLHKLLIHIHYYLFVLIQYFKKLSSVDKNLKKKLLTFFFF